MDQSLVHIQQLTVTACKMLGRVRFHGDSFLLSVHFVTSRM